MDTLQKINCGGFYLGEGLAVEKDENGRNVLSASGGGGGGGDVTTFYIEILNQSTQHTSVWDVEAKFYDSPLFENEISMYDIAEILFDKVGKTQFVGMYKYRDYDSDTNNCVGYAPISVSAIGEHSAILGLSVPVASDSVLNIPVAVIPD